MTVKSGFFNSVDSDRVYSAEDFSMLFEGLLSDGILGAIGNEFQVTTNGDMTLTVKSGRAWLDHTWIDNDGDEVISFSTSDPSLDRWDILVVEMNRTIGVRENSILVVEGVPAVSPSLPTLIFDTDQKQYALSNVFVPAGSTAINISNVHSQVDEPGGIPYFEDMTDNVQNQLDSLVASDVAIQAELDAQEIVDQGLQSDIDAIEAVNVAQQAEIDAQEIVDQGLQSDIDAIEAVNVAQQAELDAQEIVDQGLQSDIDAMLVELGDNPSGDLESVALRLSVSIDDEGKLRLLSQPYSIVNYVNFAVAATGDVNYNTITGDNIANAATGDVYRNTITGDNIANAATDSVYHNTITGSSIANATTGDVNRNAITGYNIADAATGNVNRNTITGNNIANAATGDVNHNTITGYNIANAAIGSVNYNTITGNSIANAATGNVIYNTITGYNIANAATGSVYYVISIGENVLSDTSNVVSLSRIVALMSDVFRLSTALDLTDAIGIGYRAGYQNQYNSPALFGREASAKNHKQVVIGSAYYTGGVLLDAAKTFISNVPDGATQVLAGAGVDELWRTKNHATLPDNVLMIGE